MMFPAGKVIRDKLEREMGRGWYWVRRVIPFTGLVIPVIYYRLRRSDGSMYKEDPEIYKLQKKALNIA